MIRVFVDFDGTITIRDVGDAMFERFGGARAVDAVNRYRSSNLTAAGCFLEECHACGEFGIDELNRFIDDQQIDETFIPFSRFCGERGFGLVVVSDGMDYYIRRILSRYGLDDVPSHSNILGLISETGDGMVRMSPEFPFQDETCDRCACCKRNYMITNSSDDDLLVYIGEGYSDRCPVKFADVVFAKDELLAYCRQDGIPFHEYSSFAGVQAMMARWSEANGSSGSSPLRPRRQARLARAEVFGGG